MTTSFDLSPDGRQVAYLVSKTFLEMAVADIDGSNERILTNEAVRESLGIRTDSFLLGPTWSPDGRFIAFAVLAHEIEGWNLATLEIASGRVNSLVEDGYAPAWSSDSSQIVFQRSNGQIWIVNADGTGLTQLTSQGHNCCPIWIP